MSSKPHNLGEYGAVSGSRSSQTCARLELKAASDDGHIDTAKGTYFVGFYFWKANDGAYANVEYNTHGFAEVFAKVRPMLKNVAEVLEFDKSDISKNVTMSNLERCIADLEKQTQLLGTITELPPTPMCK